GWRDGVGSVLRRRGYGRRAGAAHDRRARRRGRVRRNGRTRGRDRAGNGAHPLCRSRPDAPRLENRVGTEPLAASAELRLQPADYCRDIETYLCRKNDGHLIRVVGPSFELVARWAADGVPLKIAFQGIDRYFERYYRRGPRRRPVKIDFCEADVLDAFDEWRRAVGIGPQSAIANQSAVPESAMPESAIPESAIPDRSAIRNPQSAIRRSIPPHHQ